MLLWLYRSDQIYTEKIRLWSSSTHEKVTCFEHVSSKNNFIAVAIFIFRYACIYDMFDPNYI